MCYSQNFLLKIQRLIMMRSIKGEKIVNRDDFGIPIHNNKTVMIKDIIDYVINK